METTVAEKPILFSGEMVRAILDDRKRMTRRVVKNQHSIHIPSGERHWVNMQSMRPAELMRYCPYEVGQHLWVRETFRETFDIDDRPVMEYRAGGTRLIVGKSIQNGEHRITSILPHWRPSIFMPRWASRITLEITEVRVERLNRISWSDAIAEGCHDPRRAAIRIDETNPKSPVYQFRELWESINGKKYPWDSNPWVWVVSFKRI